MNILSIIKVTNLVLFTWSYRTPPPLCPQLNLEYLAYFEHAVRSLLDICLSSKVCGCYVVLFPFPITFINYIYKTNLVLISIKSIMEYMQKLD